MQYMLSYVHGNDGINISFQARYETLAELTAGGTIPTAPMQKANRTPLFKGDEASGLPMEIHCGFQED